MQRIFAQERVPIRSSIPSPTCQHRGCSKRTQERKTHCSVHVLEIDKAKSVHQRLAEAEAEVVRVGEEGWPVADVDGLVVEEILAGIASRGQVTWRRLCKDSVFFFNEIPHETTDQYLEAIRREGLVKAGLTARQSVIVELTPKGFQKVQKRF